MSFSCVDFVNPCLLVYLNFSLKEVSTPLLRPFHQCNLVVMRIKMHAKVSYCITWVFYVSLALKILGDLQLQITGSTGFTTNMQVLINICVIQLQF